MFDLHKPILHANADWSLIRGALDNFATAFWVLHPNQRTYRIEHALRWRVQDYKAEKQATAILEPGEEATVDAKIEKVIQFAKDAHCKVKEVKGGYVSKTALEYVDKYSHATNAYFMWQLCSGFAHGRPWASFAMNEMEILDSSAEHGAVSIKFTSDRKKLSGTKTGKSRSVLRMKPGLRFRRRTSSTTPPTTDQSNAGNSAGSRENPYPIEQTTQKMGTPTGSIR